MRQMIVLLLATAQMGAVALAAPMKAKILPVPPHGQEETMWCWAASDEMVLDYFKRHVEQCDEVTKALGVSPLGCCVRQRPHDCLQGYGISIGLYGFDFPGGTLTTWKEITQEINSKRPFESVWIYFSDQAELARKKERRRLPLPVPFAHSIGHNTVAYGYINLPLLKLVLVHDPLYEDDWLYSEEAFASGPGYERNDYSQIHRVSK
jgi:hypothetical protein